MNYFIAYEDFDPDGSIVGIQDYYIGIDIPDNTNGRVWLKSTKEIVYDFLWNSESENYFKNQELSSLWKSLDRTAQLNLTDETLDGWNNFYGYLYVYHEWDKIKRPYELTIGYRDSLFSTTENMDDTQIEVFNDMLIFGKYLETKTTHSNMLSKFYDLFNPAVTTMVDGVEKTTIAQIDTRLTLFDKSLYPSLNPAPVEETVAPTSAIKTDDEGKPVFKVPVDETEEVEEENPTA